MTTRALRVAILAILFSATAAFAQTTTVDFGPSREDILKLLDLTQGRRNMIVALDGMKKQMRDGARQGFKTKVPDATPEQLARVDKIVDAMFADFPYDEVFNAVIPVYQRHLTKQDVDGLISFYSTPFGQKIIREMPAILSESMQAGADVTRRQMAERIKRIDEQIEQMRKEEEMNSAPKSHPDENAK